MTLYSPGGVNYADTTAPLILAFDDSGTTDVVFSISASGDLTITPDGGDVTLVANVGISGVITVTKATAGDAIVWTNSGGTPKTGYLYSDDTIVGLFNVADAGENRFGLRITPTSVVLEANAAETLTLTASGLTSSIQFRATPGSSGQPGVASSADTNTGLLWLGSDVLGITADGALRIAIAPTTFAFRDTVVLGWDSAGDPTGGGIDTNFYRNSAGVLKTDGAFVAVSTVTASDFIGTIGADTPAAGAFTTGAFSGVLTASDDIKLAATKRHYFDGGGNTYAVESSSDVLDLVVGAATTLRVTPTGVVVTGTGEFTDPVSFKGTGDSILTNISVPGGTPRWALANTSNTADSNAVIRIRTAGISGGNPSLNLAVAGTIDWSMGIDVSDSRILKWGVDPAVGTSVRMSLTTAGDLAFIGDFGMAGIGPQAQQAHIVDADGSLADITTKFNTLLANQEGFGFQAAA